MKKCVNIACLNIADINLKYGLHITIWYCTARIMIKHLVERMMQNEFFIMADDKAKNKSFPFLKPVYK